MTDPVPSLTSSPQRLLLHLVPLRASHSFFKPLTTGGGKKGRGAHFPLDQKFQEVSALIVVMYEMSSHYLQSQGG